MNGAIRNLEDAARLGMGTLSGDEFESVSGRLASVRNLGALGWFTAVVVASGVLSFGFL